jgi:hypothetical protein
MFDFLYCSQVSMLEGCFQFDPLIQELVGEAKIDDEETDQSPPALAVPQPPPSTQDANQQFQHTASAWLFHVLSDVLTKDSASQEASQPE